MELRIGTLVKNKDTGKTGVVVNDFLGCCSEGEEPIVYEGATSSLGTSLENLEILGLENAQADPQKCGAGQGEKCCMFLVFDTANGFECQRFGHMRNKLIFRKESLTAKREPTELFPDCQLG